MKNERQQTQDLEMLSDFLDDALSKAQREKLEARLELDPELRLKLENLRKTKIILGRLPRLHAPKNFMLTPDMVTVRKPKRRPLFTSLRMATALAALLLVVVLGSDLLLGSGILASRPMMAEESAKDFDAAYESTPQPLIQWGGSGIGGGGTGESPQGGGIDTYIFEEPVGEMRKAEESSTVEEEAMPEAVPEIEAEPAPEMQLAPEDAEELSMLSAEGQSADSNDPILGINPEQAGQIIDQSKPSGKIEQPGIKWQSVIRWIEIALGAILVGSGLAWLILRKRFA